MKRAYSTNPVNVTYDAAATMNLQSLNLATFKGFADSAALQFDITVKTDGIRVTVIKKGKDKAVRKRSIECDNEDLGTLMLKIQTAITEIANAGMMFGGI
jgi:hypothetical protein